MISRVRTYVRTSVRPPAPLYLLDRVRLSPDRRHAIRVRMRAAQFPVVVAHEYPATGGEFVDGEPLQGFAVSSWLMGDKRGKPQPLGRPRAS